MIPKLNKWQWVWLAVSIMWLYPLVRHTISIWPDGQEAARLTIVGESRLDTDGNEYLKALRSRFTLPIYYEQVTAK